MPVAFHTIGIPFLLKGKTVLRTFIQKQFNEKRKKSLSLNCIFCSDDYLLDINRQFLQHDYYTDIITFPLEETDKKVTAEIYISIDRVRENAKKNNVPEAEELYRVIFHGLLHLCGYGDKTRSEQKQMREKENEWLAAFSNFLPKGS